MTPHQGLIRATQIALSIAALALLALLAVKAWVDVDKSFDSWWYHLPWAARLAGIVPAAAFEFEPIAANRFEGLPVLPELLQGLAWRITGRAEAANLVSFASLLVLVTFLANVLRVPFWLSVPAFLAIPLVQAQATRAYVDLIANVGMAIAVLALYRLWCQQSVRLPRLWLWLVGGSIVAAHSKFQLIPVVGLVAIAAAPLVWLAARKAALQADLPAYRLGFGMFVILIVLTSVFWAPVRNIVMHGNPAYPLELKIAGHMLPGPEGLPPADLGSGLAAEAPRPLKWVYSVSEYGTGHVTGPSRWSVDSTQPASANTPLGIQGGLHGWYVALHLLLFGLLLGRLARRERWVACLVVGVGAAVAAVMPASHLLRYYMSWFFAVVALNLHMLVEHASPVARAAAGAVALAFVIWVIDISDQNFIRPRFEGASQLLAERVNPVVLEQIRGQGGRACLVLDSANQPFLYASVWHPGTDFALRAGPFHPDDDIGRVVACRGWAEVRALGRQDAQNSGATK